MDIDLAILSSVSAIVLLTLYLRTNIALAIFSLGIGYILADFTASSLVSMLYTLGASGTTLPLDTIAGIFLTVLPAFLILFRFRRFQSGRFFEHVFPAIFFALLLSVLVFSLLPLDFQQELKGESYIFDQLEYFRTAIVVGAAFIAMFDVMIHEQKLRKKSKRRKRKIPE
ncbi:MAG TPA: hypothetical protein VF996_01420 [Candidatus Saccharimonadales bacterium]|jgi:hypothetical protein